MKQKEYISAPLPFMGQKRMFRTEFRKVLKQFDDRATFVDLFGGSGLLSHITKREKPHATVIYNDYDNYSRRLAHIPQTNAVLTDLRKIVEECPRQKMIAEKPRKAILERVAAEDAKGYVDYITLSSSVLFSMKYSLSFDDLRKETFYNTVRKTDYDAIGYLDGLTVVRDDYKTVFERYRNVPGVVFLVDPPYLSTEAKSYRLRWRLGDYLDVLKVLQGTSFVYFTSNKSSILELCEWIQQSNLGENPFAGADKRMFNAHMNHNSSYTDIMLYKNAYKTAA